MVLKDIAKILLIIFCIYVFYKGIREKNKIKIVLPSIILLIIAIIKIRMQILGIIGIVLLLLFFWTVSFLPYVIGIIISIIVIFVIRRKVAVVQDRGSIYISAIVITMCISTLFEPVWYEYVSARPDDTYIKIQKINDSEKLMGLSKEEVITQLGKPESTGVHDSVYRYDAGEKTSYIGFGGHTYYKLYVEFDENSKVKSSSIEIYEPPGG